MKGDYDYECELLAEGFIANTDLGTTKNIEELAQVIQDAVDDWLSFRSTETFKDLRAVTHRSTVKEAGK